MLVIFLSEMEKRNTNSTGRAAAAILPGKEIRNG